MSFIELVKVSKYYSLGHTQVKALSHIDLSIDSGEYVYITGPSGAGKSTLLHIIGLLDSPSAGKYRLQGTDTTEMDDGAKSALRREKIGFVFQSFFLFPYFNVYENVRIALRIAGFNKNVQKELADWALNEVGLFEKRFRMPDELSGGERQRVAIARAICKKPLLLIADEPTGNLDSKTGSRIITLIEKFISSNRTVIIVTHSGELARRGNKEIRIKDGEIEDIIEYRTR